MPAPKLSISVQPKVAGKVVYLPLAPASQGASPKFKLVVRLDIANQGAAAVTVSRIEVSFPTSALAPVEMVGIDLEGSWGPKEGGPEIAPSQTKTWSSGRVTLADDSTASNVMYLDAPAPVKVKVGVWCQGFSSPASVTEDLGHSLSQNEEGYYMWPLRGTAPKTKFPDLFYVTSAVHWANGGPAGRQIYAHDIGLQRFSSAWTPLVQGIDGSTNENYLIWSRDVLAMGDGVVAVVHDGMDDNTIAGQFPEPTPDPVSGNHVIVQHGSERVRYSHLRKGSIPPWITVGAQVDVGDVLGKVGNSGNSTSPHIHIEVTSSDGYLRPFPFRGIRVCALSLLHPPAKDSPWAAVDYAGIPQENVALYRFAGKRPKPVRERKRKPRFAHVPQPSEGGRRKGRRKAKKTKRPKAQKTNKRKARRR